MKTQLKLNKHVLASILTSLFLSSCNSGGTSGNGSSLEAPKPCPCSGQDKTQNFPELGIYPQVGVALGAGFDPVSRSVYNSEIVENKIDKMIDSMGNTVVSVPNETDLSYNINQVGSKAGRDTAASTFGIKGGVGIGYGLGSAKVMAGYQQDSQRLNGTVSYTNYGGVVLQKVRRLVSDYENLNNRGQQYLVSPDQKQRVREALLKADNTLYRDINEILEATPAQRVAFIKRFYVNHGTHYISSVTYAKIAAKAMTFTQQLASGQENSSHMFGAEFSVPVNVASVSGQVNANWGNATSFSKTAFEYSSRLMSLPADPVFEQIVEASLKKASDEALTLNVVDTKAMMNAPINVPKVVNMDDIKVSIDKELQKTIEKKKNSLLHMNSDINAAKAQIDSWFTEASSKEPNLDLLKKLEAELNDLLAKFKSDESTGYLLTDLRNTAGNNQVLIIDQAKIIVRSASLAERVSKITTLKMNDTSRSHASVQKDNLNVFSGWLRYQCKNYQNKNVVSGFKTIITQQNYDDKLCENGENGDSLEKKIAKKDMNKYNELVGLWEKGMKEKGIINMDDDSNNYRSAPEQVALRTSLRSESSIPSVGTTSAAIDFNIAPWSDLFPELAVTQIDDAGQIAAMATLDKIKEYGEIYRYLELIVTTTGDAELTKIYNGDSSLYRKMLALNQAVEAAFFADNKVEYAGRVYSLIDTGQVARLNSIVESNINSSLVMYSTWYRYKVEHLRRAGLLQPTGMMLMGGIVNNTNSTIQWYPFTSYSTGLKAGNHSFITAIPDSSMVKKGVPLEFNNISEIGKALATTTSRINGIPNRLLTILPLIVSDTKVGISSDKTITQITGLRFLMADKRTIFHPLYYKEDESSIPADNLGVITKFNNLNLQFVPGEFSLTPLNSSSRTSGSASFATAIENAYPIELSFIKRDGGTENKMGARDLFQHSQSGVGLIPASRTGTRYSPDEVIMSVVPMTKAFNEKMLEKANHSSSYPEVSKFY